MEFLVKTVACVSRALLSVCWVLSFFLRIQGEERVEGAESAKYLYELDMCLWENKELR